MSRDVDFLRLVLLELAQAQRSPPEPIFAPVEALARRSEKSSADVIAALELLLDLNFIDGPGGYRDDGWLFRKLTRRGVWLVDAIRDPRDWRKVKAIYGRLLNL